MEADIGIQGGAGEFEVLEGDREGGTLGEDGVIAASAGEVVGLVEDGAGGGPRGVLAIPMGLALLKAA